MIETDYDSWLAMHREARQGERLRRLDEGHSHAEKLFLQQVWWPAFGDYRFLHPEFEVFDYKDGSRFIDFAYIRPMFQVAIEIDGYGPHLRDISRSQFADQLLRQNHLTIEGWRIMRFSYDDINERPRVCQQLLQQLFGRWLGEGRTLEGTAMVEREVIKLALRTMKPIYGQHASRHGE